MSCPIFLKEDNLKRILLIIFAIILISSCCSIQERQATMTAYRLEKLYGTTFSRTKHYEEGRLDVYYKNNHDLVSSIHAYKKALKIFKKYGYDLSRCPVTIDIRFVSTERVVEANDAILYGWYDWKETKNIYASRYASDKCSEFTIMNLSTTNPDAHESMILHEISHRFLHFQFPSIELMDSEYICYIIQVESLPDYLKSKWRRVNWFLNSVKTEDINVDNYLKQPREFGARMYKHHEENPEYLLNLLKKLERG